MMRTINELGDILDLAQPDLTALPDQRHCLAELGQFADIYFPPLIYLEAFTSAALEIEIERQTMLVPFAWCIAIQDSKTGESDLVQVQHMMERGFEAILLDPTTGKHRRAVLEVTDIVERHEFIAPKFPKDTLGILPIMGRECLLFSQDDRTILDFDLAEIL